jgi:hypothetical protein
MRRLTAVPARRGKDRRPTYRPPPCRRRKPPVWSAGKALGPPSVGPRAPEAATPGNGDIAVSAQNRTLARSGGGFASPWRLPGAPFLFRENEKGHGARGTDKNPAPAERWLRMLSSDGLPRRARRMDHRRAVRRRERLRAAPQHDAAGNALRAEADLPAGG